ncbi:DAK2 domain-containing protein [Corynebacterium hindlerae]|uniref:DAK2 domain-containing protein n=1 Tax=Corynebacterium hindlerae TaxID=699041 RepID=A0A7G5FEX8_9CORY|nr:DAK2 domain-containing protein [Corynebacterium hindlerae]QMV85169.1 DAK2 domain-containing protein [Corynebacterium hindlerae]
MSGVARLDGHGLINWASRAVALLSQRCEEINALNVFPVPDADTGSNMTHTMESALAEAQRLSEQAQADVAQVAAALAAGAVRGARGNSGVVISQVLRGIATAAASGELDGEAVREALNVALDMVLRAIVDPVDGTVVTVLRATVAAVNDAADSSLEAIVGTAVSAARVALKKTPSQLEALREAGVVDAGGKGFVLLLDALADEIGGTDWNSSTHTIAHGHHSIPAELEVMFYISDADLDELTATLTPLGNSLLIARDSETSGQVHIHSAVAGSVIEQSYQRGTITDLRIEVLPGVEQAPKINRLVLAIAPAGPIAQLYSESGATVITRGAGDIVSDIVAKVRSAAVDEVILLPNGMLEYGELVNAELASHAIDAAMHILPTARLVSGIAALAVHDPGQPLAVDTYAMAEAAGSMRTAVLTRADKARLTQAGACSRGDVLVTSGADTVLVADDVQDATEKTVLRLLQGGGELVTLLVTNEAARELDVEKLRASLGTRSNVEIMVYPADGIDKLAEIGVE